jgi:hypothetical protein
MKHLFLAALLLLPIATAEAATPEEVAAAIRAQGGEAEDAVIIGGDFVMYGRYDQQGFKATLHGCEAGGASACDKVEMTSCLPSGASLETALALAHRYNETNEIGTAFTERYGSDAHVCLRFTSLHNEARDFGSYELVFWRQIFSNLKQLAHTSSAPRLASNEPPRAQ